MRANYLIAAAAALAIGGGAASAIAADAPDGTVVITAKAAALGVGYTWGDGVLIYHHHHYNFTVKGVTIADLGYAKVIGHGRVFNLKKSSDFTGTYAAATGEATLGKGMGDQVLQNSNGVKISIDEVTKGARLSASADGIQLTLD